jgi:hypothetical protein
VLDGSYNDEVVCFWVQLDQHLPELGIVSYGIGVTTMEEVFLRVAEEGAVAAAERENRQSSLHPQFPCKSSGTHPGLGVICAGAATAEAAVDGSLARPSSGQGSKKVNVRPSSPPKDHTDIEGGSGRHTIAELMKHARHDGKGMVRYCLLPLSKAISRCACHQRSC